MSGVQIPGLGAISPAVPESAAAQSTLATTPVTNDHTVTQQSQPIITDGAISKDKEPNGKGNDMAVDCPPSPPSLTTALEALLGGIDPMPEPAPAVTSSSEHVDSAMLEPEAASQNEQPVEANHHNGEEEHPEWEVDSSPYESSSDSSSSDDSDDDSDDGKDYKILGPEETARILMEMDGGSDDEGEGKGKGDGTSLVRTKNELAEVIIPRPEVEIKPEMEIIELGEIEHFVGNTAVIKANTHGEYQVLDTGSVLCLHDRTVIAALLDVIATVREPRYTAAFSGGEEIESFGLKPGTKVFYPPVHANFGLTQALRANKGTDASNWHDEEVAEDEIEFSDDEKEAEYRRQLKAKKKEARGGREGPVGRGGRSDAATKSASNSQSGLNYEDDDDDVGPYRPLSRPTGFGQTQPSQGGSDFSGGFSGRGDAHRGGRGDFRGRGGRGRAGRGNRGGNPRGGYSLPPRPEGQGGYGVGFQPPPIQQYNLPAAPPMQMNGQPFPIFPPQPNIQQPQNPSLPQFPFLWPQSAQPGFYPPPPPPPQFAAQQGANGMFFNPSFLATLQNQIQNQHNQQQHNQQQQNQQQQNQQQHNQQQHPQQQNNQWTGQPNPPNNQWMG